MDFSLYVEPRPGIEPGTSSLPMDVLYQLSYLGALFASHAHFFHDTHSPVRFCQDSYLGVFYFRPTCLALRVKGYLGVMFFL